MINDMNERSREILRLVVESFVETGEPVGSRTLSRLLQGGGGRQASLSPATIRNVMADLEDSGLLYAPHTSAGRLPTDAGLRLFVDGLLEIGNLSEQDRSAIEERCAATGKSLNQVLEEASGLMSGLSKCAGLVFAPKTDARLKHVEFVPIGPGRALVVVVTESGLVENRVIELPMGLPSSALNEATNFLSAKLAGNTLEQTRELVDREIAENRAQIDELTAKVVEAGLATWSEMTSGDSVLIVRGQANLLEDVQAIGDLEHIRALFSALEAKENMSRLLQAAEGAEGVQIFIGSDSELFSLAGCSMIVSPYSDASNTVVGAIGVVGPTRMNYARIIPMVDYTSKVVGRLLGHREAG